MPQFRTVSLLLIIFATELPSICTIDNLLYRLPAKMNIEVD
jgi:hypothetical protein